MSKKLKAAVMTGKVVVKSKQSGEVSIWYRDRNGARQFTVVTGFSTVELAPKLTDAERLQWSNVETLAKAGSIRIL